MNTTYIEYRDSNNHQVKEMYKIHLILLTYSYSKIQLFQYQKQIINFQYLLKIILEINEA